MAARLNIIEEPVRPPVPSAATPTGQSAANIATAQISVGAVATLISAARANRQAITIEMTGAVDIYIRGDNTVTTANGFLIPGTKGANMTIPTSSAIWGISSGAAVTVSVLETF